MRLSKQLLALMVPVLLAACGDYSGSSATGKNIKPGEDTGQAPRTKEDWFAANVQPGLGVCRICHVPGATAALSEQGKLFMLSSNSAEDLDNFEASWLALGGGSDSRILKMASGDESHSGGALWPSSSGIYQSAALYISCLADATSCVDMFKSGDTPSIENLPLLGSARGGHYWFDYCDGKDDSTLVPADPRELVQPGINQDKAVHMNIHWQTCQADNHPGTCGELRQRVRRGYPLVASDGEIGAGHFFSGNASTSGFAFSSTTYSSMWEQIWRLSERPANFDELVAERWGMPLSPTNNPYPLPGEDPNLSNGGSGQLPMGVTQLRNADGSWTGNLNVTCSICHGGKVGEVADGPGLGPMYGNNSLSDITVMFTDLARLAPQQAALALISQNKVRGTGNITNFQLFGTLTITDFAGLPGYLSIQTQPSTGTEDPPVWWNVGHRVAKFFDGGMVTDAKRIELSFHFPNTPMHMDMAADKKWITDHQQDSDAWIMSLKSPAWPETSLGEINTALAEQGAILFHSKNLWASTLNNPVPQPTGGNGSCASCHGAYSPRYVNDPNYLDTPLLEGIAANVVPIEIIATDRRRLDGNSPLVVQASRTNWFAYSDGEKNAAGVPLCGNQNDVALRGERKLGYLAPPLYGVWATAPYFHNGSVPNLWEVLKPTDRPSIWRRLSKEAAPNQVGKVVMGFDSSLDRGYDRNKVGWNYEPLNCGNGTIPYLDCSPSGGVTVQTALSLIWANGGLAWNLLNPPLLSDRQLEDRKIYNTTMYSQSNKGHEFTSVLTDQERLALIEYMKTL
ncbi:MAG: hypothetical protein U0998_11505 [Moraxellaceae bacterium]|nr:hypothetical protein [Moraxellaceae bacterium]MDZ4387799.1 hypothetical protein [Moraxellaceae bacterium]